jgi:hypothetical protein
MKIIALLLISFLCACTVSRPVQYVPIKHADSKCKCSQAVYDELDRLMDEAFKEVIDADPFKEDRQMWLDRFNAIIVAKTAMSTSIVGNECDPGIDLHNLPPRPEKVKP